MLAAIWRTKCWPNRQFTLILEVTEANAANARASVQKKNPDPRLRICEKLVNLMLNNNFDCDGRIDTKVDRTRKRALVKMFLEEHNLELQPINTGTWDNENNTCMTGESVSEDQMCNTLMQKFAENL